MNTNSSTKLSAEEILKKSFDKNLKPISGLTFEEVSVGTGYKWIYEAMEEYASQQREDEGVREDGVASSNNSEAASVATLSSSVGNSVEQVKWWLNQPFVATDEIMGIIFKHGDSDDEGNWLPGDKFYPTAKMIYEKVVAPLLNTGQGAKECDATPAKSISEPLANNHLTGEEAGQQETK